MAGHVLNFQVRKQQRHHTPLSAMKKITKKPYFMKIMNWVFPKNKKPYMLKRQRVCADERVNSDNSSCKFSFSSKGYLTAILGNSLAQCDLITAAQQLCKSP